MYVLVENLRLYLESEEVQIAANGGFNLPRGNETYQIPLFLGRRFQYNAEYKDMFIAGGSGYVLNKAGLKTLITSAIPHCQPYKHEQTSEEDVVITKCLRDSGVWPFITMDEEKGQRFIQFKVWNNYTHLNTNTPIFPLTYQSPNFVYACLAMR